MKKDTEKTKVRFYIERGSNDDVFAYFPDMQYYGGVSKKEAGEYGFDLKMRSCYQHIGQHSACHPGYVRGLKKATPDQYKDLKEELESIGYNLEIK